jgi:hypothetical protein
MRLCVCNLELDFKAATFFRNCATLSDIFDKPFTHLFIRHFSLFSLFLVFLVLFFWGGLDNGYGQVLSFLRPYREAS